MEWHCNVHEAYGKDFQFHVQSQMCDKCDASLGVFSNELSEIEGAQLVDMGRLGGPKQSPSLNLRRQICLSQEREGKPTWLHRVVKSLG